MIEAIAGPLARQRLLERLGLEQPAAGDPVRRPVGEGALLPEGLLVLAVDQVQVPFRREPVPIPDHLRDLERGVDVHQGEGDVSQEGLPRQPEQDGAVLPDGPEHAQALEVGVGLPQDVHAAVLQLIQVVHGRQS